MARTSNRHFFAPVRRVVTVAATGALATGVLLLASPTAEAAPVKPIRESTIKSECADAGGTYSTHIEGGSRQSSCTYSDYKDVVSVDFYTNGHYTHSNNP